MSYTGLTDTRRHARKPYRCESCGCAIPAGSLYSRRTYVLDGELMDEKLHTYCRAELDWYLETTHEDEFQWEWVQDFVNEEMLSHGFDPYDEDGDSE